MPNKRPSNKRPKYFPNNWKAYKDSPDEFFIPLTYKDFFNWKVMGWVLPSSVACVIREEKDGKISEKIYSQSAAAKKYLDTKMNVKEPKTTFTIVDDNINIRLFFLTAYSWNPSAIFIAVHVFPTPVPWYKRSPL